MATIVVSITEAKARLPDLLSESEAGNEVIITRRGKPVVRFELAAPIETPERRA